MTVLQHKCCGTFCHFTRATSIQRVITIGTSMTRLGSTTDAPAPPRNPRSRRRIRGDGEAHSHGLALAGGQALGADAAAAGVDAIAQHDAPTCGQIEAAETHIQVVVARTAVGEGDAHIGAAAVVAGRLHRPLGKEGRGREGGGSGWGWGCRWG